jgi:hypothetical protein
MWVLHNRRLIYFITVTNNDDFLFAALETPEIITFE